MGSGSIGGTVTISSATPASQGGTVAPGNSIGTLTVGGMAWQPSGTYAFEHQADSTQFNGGTGGNPNPGVDNDVINSATGTLNLSGLNNTASTTQFTFSLLPSFTTTGFTPTGPVAYQAATFQNITLPTPTNPFGTVDLVNGPTGATDISSLFNFTGAFASTPIAAVSGGVLYVQFTPVPEPMFMLAACSVAGLGAWWRRTSRPFVPMAHRPKMH
jgi:hypothetical protein